VEECEYFVFSSFFVVNINQTAKHSAPWYLKTALLQFLHYASGAIWALESAFYPLRPNRFMSPYIACTARTRKSKGKAIQEPCFGDSTEYNPNRDASDPKPDNEK
jgi:hypothetical protein